MQEFSAVKREADCFGDEASDLTYVYILDECSGARRATFTFLSEKGFAPRSFQTTQDFFENLDHLPPGCVIVGELSGESSVSRLLAALGDRIAEFPVVVSASQGDVSKAVQAMKLGASDVLELPFGRDVLPAMLRSIAMQSAERISTSRSARAARALVRALSAREGDVLRLLLSGSTNKQIAGHLNLSLRTVEMHRASMMGRLGAKNLVDAFRIALAAEVRGRTPDRGLVGSWLVSTHSR